MDTVSQKLWLYFLLIYIFALSPQANAKDATPPPRNIFRKQHARGSDDLNAESDAAVNSFTAKISREKSESASTNSQADSLKKLEFNSVLDSGSNEIGVLPTKPLTKSQYQFTDLESEKGPNDPKILPSGVKSPSKKNFFQKNKKSLTIGSLAVGAGFYLDEVSGTAMGSTIVSEITGSSTNPATNKPKSEYDLGPLELKALNVKFDK